MRNTDMKPNPPTPMYDDMRSAHLRRTTWGRRGLVAGAAAASLALASVVGVAAAGTTNVAGGTTGSTATSAASTTSSTHGTNAVVLGTGSGSSHASTAGS
jgi:hypothetical protein